MAIVLIGIPGAGKSTVGALLAKQLAFTFIDTDEVIEQRAGKSISDIFIQDGEQSFRAIEKSVISDLLQGDQLVMSLGGGALVDEDTRNLVKSHDCVWLVAGLTQAVNRVGMNRNRPLLLGNVRGQLADLMTAREPLYIECAKHIVETNKLTAKEVAQEIKQLLQEAK